MDQIGELIIKRTKKMGDKWAGGKGDKRRKGANDEKYKEGWDRIWNTERNNDKQKPNTKQHN